MSFLDLITSQLGSSGMSQLGKSIGADTEMTGHAVGAALPLLVAALGRNAGSQDGAASLHRALERDHDGSILDDVGGFFRRGDTSPGAGILKHALGGRTSTVTSGLSQATGLDASAIAKLLPMLAPLVMGALGKQHRAGGGGAGALAGLLASEEDRATQAAPALKGLGGLLDQDGDGKVGDDIARIGKGLLGGLFGK